MPEVAMESIPPFPLTLRKLTLFISTSSPSAGDTSAATSDFAGSGIAAGVATACAGAESLEDAASCADIFAASAPNLTTMAHPAFSIVYAGTFFDLESNTTLVLSGWAPILIFFTNAPDMPTSFFATDVPTPHMSSTILAGLSSPHQL